MGYCSVIISFLGSPKESDCKINQACEASCQLTVEKVGAGGAGREKALNANLTGRHSFAGLGSFSNLLARLCFCSKSVDGKRFPTLILHCSRVQPMVTMCTFKILKARLISIPVH